jgi:hypothetical protein
MITGQVCGRKDGTAYASLPSPSYTLISIYGVVASCESDGTVRPVTGAAVVMFAH